MLISNDVIDVQKIKTIAIDYINKNDKQEFEETANFFLVIYVFKNLFACLGFPFKFPAIILLMPAMISAVSSKTRWGFIYTAE